MQPGWRKGEDLDAVFGDADRVLELSRQRAIARYRCPAIGQNLHMRASKIDHRFYCKEHARLQYDAFAGTADVHDIRFIVK